MSSRSTDFLQKIVPIGQAVTNERASVASSQLGHKNMSQAVSLPSNLQGSKSLGPMQPSETLPQPSSCGAQGIVTCTASEWGTPLESLTASLTQKQDTPLANATYLDDLLQKLESDIIEYEHIEGNCVNWSMVFKSMFESIDKDLQALKKLAKTSRAIKALTKVYRLSNRLDSMFSILQDRANSSATGPEVSLNNNLNLSSSYDSSESENFDCPHTGNPSTQQILVDLTNSPDFTEFIKQIVFESVSTLSQDFDVSLQNLNGRLSHLEDIRVRNRDISHINSNIRDLGEKVRVNTTKVTDLENALQNMHHLNDKLKKDLKNAETANEALTFKVTQLSEELSSLKCQLPFKISQSVHTQNISVVDDDNFIEGNFDSDSYEDAPQLNIGYSDIQAYASGCQPLDSPLFSSSRQSLKTISPPASRQVDSPTLSPTESPFTNSTVEQMEISLDNATKKLTQLICSNPVSVSSSKDAIQHMQKTVCIQIAETCKKLHLAKDWYEIIPREQQDLVLIECAKSAISKSDDWICLFSSVYENLDYCFKLSDDNHPLSVPKGFSKKILMSVCEPFTRLQFASVGKGMSARWATLLHEHHLYESVNDFPFPLRGKIPI